MTYVELSRRVGKLSTTTVFLGLEPKVRVELASLVSEADDFEELPDWVQEIVLEAESEGEARVL